MAFSRNKAIEHAETHWNIPSDDGIFWLSNQGVIIDQVRRQNVIGTKHWKAAPEKDGWQPFFVDDGSGGESAVFRRTNKGVVEEILINDWDGIADCAHFLSRCLTAGGVSVSELGVTALVNKLQDRTDTKTLCERVSRDAGQRIIDTGILKKGDMIGYWNIDPKGDYSGRQNYVHSTMYVGKVGGKKDGGITCHTICRFPGKSWVEDSWWLRPPGHYLYTFIHFAVDDPTPDPSAASALAGWWKLDYSGKTEYYLIQKKGSAKYTKRAPTKGQTVVNSAEGSAYWFMAPTGEVTFTWRNTGTVEVWTPAGAGYTSKINGGVPATPSKLP